MIYHIQTPDIKLTKRMINKSKNYTLVYHNDIIGLIPFNSPNVLNRVFDHATSFLSYKIFLQLQNTYIEYMIAATITIVRCLVSEFTENCYVVQARPHCSTNMYKKGFDLLSDNTTYELVTEPINISDIW